MSDNNLSFEQIISAMPEEAMMFPYQHKRKSELADANKQLISPEKQKFYLAFYTKAAYEHVGFSSFSPENQEKFKSEIEKLYANIQQDRPQGEFLSELASK
jgi:L-lactate utilization protein LutC